MSTQNDKSKVDTKALEAAKKLKEKQIKTCQTVKK